MNQEDEIHRENLAFLRSQTRPSQARRSSSSRDHIRRLMMLEEETTAAMNEVSALRRRDSSRSPQSGFHLAARRQRTERARSPGSSTNPGYNVPMQGFYSWMASHSQGANDANSDVLDIFRNGLNRERNAESGNENRNSIRQRDGGNNSSGLQQVTFSDPSAVTTADLLQATLRRPRLSSRPRGTDMLASNYITEQDRMLNRRGEGSHLAARYRDLDSYNTVSLPYVQEAIRYLDRLRNIDAYNHPPEVQGKLHLLQRRSSAFVKNCISIAPQISCSWLHPGLSFEGSQHATHPPKDFDLRRRHVHHHHHGLGRRLAGHDSVFTNLRRRDPQFSLFSSGDVYWSAAPDTFDNMGDDSSPSRRPSDDGASDSPDTEQNTTSDRSEHWPVKVTIHDINYRNMTLCGTMEAYNIPDKPLTNQNGTHIVTFLEGEIVDFNRHSLRTRNFNANLEIDANYWHSLEPFKDMTDEEMMENLLNEEYMKKRLGEKYLLMRWKGKFFLFFFFLFSYWYTLAHINLQNAVSYHPHMSVKVSQYPASTIYVFDVQMAIFKACTTTMEAHLINFLILTPRSKMELHSHLASFAERHDPKDLPPLCFSSSFSSLPLHL